MLCPSSIGCGALPTLTVIASPETLTAGRCFSVLASAMFGVSSVIFSPQHDIGTPLLQISPVMLPQCLQMKNFCDLSKTILLSIFLGFLLFLLFRVFRAFRG
jgi:hypothetical protein